VPGLLDIFGFENFKQNSFEQLCINFTNEKLQAHFMDSLVKLRLEEYTREGIDCEKINFPDNQAQLTLLDHKSKGVFALLDDQCKAPGGNDQGVRARTPLPGRAGRTLHAADAPTMRNV
jgi:myosin heavy subunit